MNKKNRLKKKRDFEDVFKKGRAVNGSFLFVKYKNNDLAMPRLGFVVSAKIAKKAVERNKIKRIFSEAVKDIIGGLDGKDIIVFATRKTTTADKSNIREDLLGVLNKIQ